MDVGTLDRALAYLEQDERLAAETNLSARTDALDFIAFAQEFIQVNYKTGGQAALADRLAAIKARLTAINAELFRRIRTRIEEGRSTPASLRLEFDQYTDYARYKKGLAHIGPDALDTLLDGVLGAADRVTGIQPPHPEMVHYEPTPARAILDVADNAGLQSDDVFYDLGAGTGRAPILFQLVTGIKAKGIEIDSYLCSLARDRARHLGLAEVEFINADARQAEYPDGTVFFMFTPFKGSVFETVMNNLHSIGKSRPIRICTYGACSQWVAEQPWLRNFDGNFDDPFKAAIFYST